MKFKTPYIFKNRKTGYAIDFGICKFMIKNVNNNYTSNTCPGCYSAKIINVYPALRKKIESIKIDISLINDFKDDIQKIKDAGNRFIRFYSLGDYSGDLNEIEFIRVAASILPVELFSKTLHSYFIADLYNIAQIPNTHISLSFNKEWTDDAREKTWEFLKENNILKNVQLNYTFTGDEKYAHKSYVSVYHTTRKDKFNLGQLMGQNRVCCLKDEDGNKLNGPIQNHTGSCNKCALCRLPAADKLGNILVPKLRTQLYGN